MANLYTKTGDKGQTGLVGGSRVGKGDIRVECYGTVDEANSMLGLAYAKSENAYVRETVHKIQQKLFSLGAELASDEKALETLKWKVTEEDVSFLEAVVDKCTETNGVQTHFVIPGVNEASAALHVARTIVRRAERNMIRLQEMHPLREIAMRYANRLSDAVYALARLEETLAQQAQLRETVTGLVAQKLLEQTGDLPPISLEILQKMGACAEKKAKELGVPVVFAAVDSGGALLLLQRMDGAFMGSVDVAASKAYTANAFQMPTQTLGELAAPGGALYGIEQSNQGKIILFGGGVPYRCGGRVVGGLGVSGGTPEQDMCIVNYALSLGVQG